MSDFLPKPNEVSVSTSRLYTIIKRLFLFVNTFLVFVLFFCINMIGFVFFTGMKIKICI